MGILLQLLGTLLQLLNTLLQLLGTLLQFLGTLLQPKIGVYDFSDFSDLLQTHKLLIYTPTLYTGSLSELRKPKFSAATM